MHSWSKMETFWNDTLNLPVPFNTTDTGNNAWIPWIDPGTGSSGSSTLGVDPLMPPQLDPLYSYTNSTPTGGSVDSYPPVPAPCVVLPQEFYTPTLPQPSLYNWDCFTGVNALTPTPTDPTNCAISTEIPVTTLLSPSPAHNLSTWMGTSSDNNDQLTDGSASDVSSSDSEEAENHTDSSEEDNEACAVDANTPTERYWVFKELWDVLPNVDPDCQWTEAVVMKEASDYIKYLQSEVCQALGVNRPPHEACPNLFNLDKSTPVAPAAAQQSQSSVQEAVYKRPKNGFIRYAMKNRKAVAREYPKLDNREISRMLGVKWKRLSKEDKKQYEEEFQAEMAERKKIFPDWKYGMTKRSLIPDLDDPIPTRLRPRDKLKRKFYPGQLKRLYKRRKVAPRRRSVWVQCDRCGKWRQMPEGTESQTLPDKWYCEYNIGPYNSCLVAEETNIPATDDSSSSSIESQKQGYSLNTL